MQLSNDTKWNKIQAIERIIAVGVESEFFIYSQISQVDCKKLKKIIWEKANEIYDLLVEEEEEDCRDSYYPQHWKEVIVYVNKLGDFHNRHSHLMALCYVQRDVAWKLYDYYNS